MVLLGYFYCTPFAALRFRACLSLLLVLLCAASARAQTPPPKPGPIPAQTDRMNEFPTLYQQDERAHFDGNGVKFCGPVAASNALVWLAAHGYPRLLPDGSGDTLYGGLPYATSKTTKAQIALVHAIMENGLIAMRPDDGTPQSGGTTAQSIARGVRSYVESKGYQIEQLQTASVVSDPPADYPEEMRPRVLPLETVKKAFADGAAIWLSIGWYERDGPEGLYVWKGGHFVTLVGFGKDATGKTDPSVLIFRNPARNSGANYPNEFVHVSRLTGGNWATRDGKVGYSAAGRFVVNGLEVSGRTSAIITGATILRLKPPAPP